MRRLRLGGVVALLFATACSSLRISTFACAIYAKDLRVYRIVFSMLALHHVQK